MIFFFSKDSRTGRKPVSRSSCLVRRSLVVFAIAAGFSLAAINVTRAQDEPPQKGNPRDVAAVDQAINGWWTDSMKTRDQRLQWWRDARFGCFIHWGVYSGPAGEWNGHASGTYAEHLMRTQRIPLAEYQEKVVSVFDPQQFDADKWVALIKGAGMKYVIITAKHHDGFAMWPSDVNKYNIRDATPFKRDPMAELSEACRKNGIRFGFYYSHAWDWADPNGTGNDWDYKNPSGDKGLFGGKDWADEHPEQVARVQKYIDGKCIPQLQELIAKYHPDIFWFDISGKIPLSLQLRVVQAVRAADPNVVINGRAARGLGYNFGDYQDTADRPAELRPTAGDWECIPTCNESYGYHKLDNHYKPPSHFIQLLAKAAAKGGNVLLNIGPMGNGLIDPNSTAILQGIGKWMAVNSESIYSTQRTPLERQAWGESTLKGNTLYLHVFDWPTDGQLIVGGLVNDATSAYLLSDPQKTPVKTERLNDHDLAVTVPALAPDAVDSVIVLQVQGEIKTYPGRLLAAHGIANRLLAFDGQLHGKDFTYGDGKTPNYYVAGFSDPADSISWNTRLDEPATFDVSIKYRATGDQPGGYLIKFGDQTLTGRITPTANAKEIQHVTLGRITLPAGEEEIRILPSQTSSGDLMQLFEIILTPAVK
jgi:alpha-L-fucosidase